jgi:hypothetical protein
MDPTPAPQPPWARLLPVRPALALPPQARAVFLWGDARVHTVALHTAARMLARGLQVAIIDAAMAFQLRPFVAMAKACRVPPEVFLRRVHIVRTFTCWQFTTLFCERLHPLLATHPIGLVLLLNPLTHFFDEAVTRKEARLLFQRVLQTLAKIAPEGPRFLMAQTVPAYRPPGRRFAGDLLRAVEVGLRLLPGEGRWSIEVVKPKPPGDLAQGVPDRTALTIIHF